jgi:hypothetical protein
LTSCYRRARIVRAAHVHGAATPPPGRPPVHDPVLDGALDELLRLGARSTQLLKDASTASACGNGTEVSLILADLRQVNRDMEATRERLRERLGALSHRRPKAG